ncbi:hypothetical protein TcasGA2_TC001282 [Tribolium castaneum]|uniref:Uncharacterized protein n=1 Tax=Tribolium castaneum TaxID=7070 RepID=D6WBF8_TRICA|nr:PREDICTED: uncharacterized protein LOC100142559 [Tribolium castaneum]EEZ98729.1 hypothetical protein TcasGA2_TC001282 [Tribolium castaneum]|eukprot:XP_001815109.3 PREDICTED: uncharacterized protein LOC100142559 [Tribolium castaneum]
MVRVVFAFCVIIASALAIESNFYREEACAKVGGYCVLQSECPHSVSDDQKGLCAGQKKDGAVCCPNFPEQDVNCHQLHHGCSDRCPKNLSLGRKGCTDGKTCCVLVV